MNKNITTLIALLLLSSCGGSGGGGSNQTLIPLSSSDIRTYKQGDSFTVSMVFTDTGTKQTATGDITLTVGPNVTNPSGISCFKVIYSGTLTGPAGTVPITTTSYYYQDINNNVYDCGESDNGTDVFVTDTAITPNGLALNEKSPMALGNIISGITNYTDGSWNDCTSNIVGKENVSTTIGYYEAYKINYSCSYSNGSTLVGTEWVVPDLFTIKEVDNYDTYSISYTLKSYFLN